MPKQDQTPIKILRSGRISAAIFQRQSDRQGQNRTEHEICIRKRYKDAQGQWRSTETLYPDELPRLAAIAQRAYEFLMVREGEPSDAHPNGE